MSDYFESQIRMLARYLQEHWQEEIKEEETAAELAIRLLSEVRPTQRAADFGYCGCSFYHFRKIGETCMRCGHEIVRQSR